MMIATDIDVPIFRIFNQSQVILDRVIISTHFVTNNSFENGTYNPFSTDGTYLYVLCNRRIKDIVVTQKWMVLYQYWI